MADTDCNGVQRDTEEAYELHYTDLNVNSSELAPDPHTLKLDHCDLLLDAIDAQLGQLQVQPQKCQVVSRGCDCNDPAPLIWCQALSKDTGLGSTTQTNNTPMSCLDLIHTPTEQTSESSTCCQRDPVTPEKAKQKLDTRDKEEIESQREQIIWRLEKLLGNNCNNGEMVGESHPPSESICTEDFVTRFRDEMVELALPESHMQQQDTEEEAERTDISDCDTFQIERKQKIIGTVDRGETSTTWRHNEDTDTAQYSESKKICSRQGLEKFLSDSYAINRSLDWAGAGWGHRTPQILGESNTISYRTEAKKETEQQDIIHPPKARCLAGIPVWNFDTVSIDSDLDSVSTEHVRQHIHKQPGLRSLIQSVIGMDDFSSIQSGCDTPTQEDSEPPHTSEQSSSRGKIQIRTSPFLTAECNKRETHRVVCSFDEDDKDTNEEINPSRRRCRPVKISERMQSDCAQMKERLSTLQHRCEEEEEKLKLKKTQLRDVELSLSDLQQRKKELEHLMVETAKMEKEKSRLEFVLEDRRAEKDSINGRLYEMQRQKKSCIAEPSVVMSVLEREELDRQLNSAKTELFAEQRRAREKLESMQEKLEDTQEELQRATDAESLLRARCACLEEKRKQEKDQMEVDLRESKIRVSTQEKMLAQKGLQFLDLKEQSGVLKAERDRLKGELQHLQTQHCNALKEAQEKVHRMTVNKQSEAERANTLKEQAVSLKRHIESLQSTIKLKDEEVRKMRDSLEQQKEEVRNCEEKLRVEALGKVHKALEEAGRKWEAEKVEAVQVNCEILEEQNRKRLENMRSEMQREKSKTVAHQQKVLELKTRVQKLESESSTQQREQESVLAVICESLKEEHRAELQKTQRQMAEESQKAAQKLEQAVQLAEKEADRLRLMLNERERSHHEITAELDQQLRHYAQELRAESQHLLFLVEQSGAKQSSVEIYPSSTVAEALTNLKVLREQLKHMISHLHQELDTKKETIEQLRKAKELELSIQRQQLRMERDQAMDCLKERLIQEHIEELSSLNVAHMCDGGPEGGGLTASLRKQLKAKDLELRQVQKSMAQWKEQTAARLACKFEEELTSELERYKTKLLRARKSSKTREETRRKPERPDKDEIPCAKEVRHSIGAASHSTSDLASLKLLSYLQSRVKQLRVENQAYTSTPLSSNTIPLDLSGSYLATITQDISRIQSLSSINTVSS
ncbi:trichohyalin isoform X2 [Notolabrus celidotus]|uniref:trichohyalin isoform X2 n=1 Tax=Notolabrus celidotus TaxID=1203425 RepID=UPI001490672C|nr:trichohyalin isoform X2 [Notolabrus celidotus]